MTASPSSSKQRELKFSRSAGLAFPVSPRRLEYATRRQLSLYLEEAGALPHFDLCRHAERIALFQELQRGYRRVRRQGLRVATPAGMRVRRNINRLALDIVRESVELCG